MFMEAPIPGKQEAPEAPEAKTAPAAPAKEAASDTKGWTVFMDGPATPEDAGRPPGAVSGEREASPAAEAVPQQPTGGKTIIAHGVPSVSAGGSAPASGQPDTMYFAKPDKAVERVGNLPPARPVTEPGVAPPASDVAVERSSESVGADLASAEASMGMAPADESDTSLTGPQDVVLAKKSSNLVPLVVIGVVVVGAIVAAALFLL
ncbi:MAG: hypothetical protein D6705_17605 [Deltaproteobacteria bacterium]|nr:MAG: hypothetical protein D6705_17605 [Deltaproteobacteria bacterium]